MSDAGQGRGRGVFRLPFARAHAPHLVDDEMRFHIEGRIDELVAAGMSRADAEAEARRRFGDLAAWRRETTAIDHHMIRSHNRLELLDAVRRELPRAVRSLVRAPGFTAVAVFTLALGIGATVALYTVLDRVVLRPLPYDDGEALVSVMHPATVPGTGESRWGLSSAGYFEFKHNTRTLEHLGVYGTGNTTVLAADDGAERRPSIAITRSGLEALRARTSTGRFFTDDDMRPDAPNVVVLGYDYWQNQYGGDSSALGTALRTADGVYEIVGVAARGFNAPMPSAFNTNVDLAGFHTDLWFPLALDSTAQPQNSHPYMGIARLRDGATADAARRELAGMLEQFTVRFPTAYSDGFMRNYNFRVDVRSLRVEMLGDRLPRIVWVLFGAVALVLLVACANVANLFLARLETRRRESAMRTALGARRAHLAVHYLSDSLLVSIAACGGALLLAEGLIRGLVQFAPRDIPRLATASLGWPGVGVAALVSLAIGLALGLFPLLRTRVDVDTLRSGARGLGHSPRQRLARNTLVVAQMSVALVLLSCAGLMFRTMQQIRDVDPGFDPGGVLTFSLSLPASAYPGDAETMAFHRSLRERLLAIPGVENAGMSTGLPLQDYGTGCVVIYREARPPAEGEQVPCIGSNRVVPGFFETLGIPVTGHSPDWTDVSGNTGATVVTRALAERLWPGEDPIGKGVNTYGWTGPPERYYRVVGVIESLHAGSLDGTPTEAVFYPALSMPTSRMFNPMRSGVYVVRTSASDPEALAGAVRAAVTALDRTVPVTNMRTMDEVVARSVARTTFLTRLLGVAATLALVLSAVGLYGVVAYVVAQRRAEIGIRMALGARSDQVARLVLRQTMALAVSGAVLGMGGAYVATRSLEVMLFGVAPHDPVVLGAVTTVLLVVAAVAGFAPARSAARVHPMEALRG